MDPELKARWINALRSGDYKQGQASLKMFIDGEHRYCCLGVLCEVKGIEWEVVESQNQVHYKIHGQGSYISGNLADDLGVGIPNKKVKPLLPDHHKTIQEHLARMNDRGKPFEEIADWIEENL